MMDVLIRHETKQDYFEVETLIREAFWNIYNPGCDEHLVLHNLRTQAGFIHELDLVAVYEHQIVGQIAYSKAYIENDQGVRTEVIIFGPVSVLPQYQRQGIGRRLIETSLKRAKKMGFRAVLITGNPQYYTRFGFAPAFNYDIHYHGIPFNYKADFFMAREITDNGLKDVHGILYDSPAFATDSEELEKFDKLFPKKVKRIKKGQFGV